MVGVGKGLELPLGDMTAGGVRMHTLWLRLMRFHKQSPIPLRKEWRGLRRVCRGPQGLSWFSCEDDSLCIPTRVPSLSLKNVRDFPQV